MKKHKKTKRWAKKKLQDTKGKNQRGRKQAVADSRSDQLVVKMLEAEQAQDWPEYNRLKAILFRTT